MIGEAGETAGLSAKFLHSIFPGELTLWVDPLEVSYRIGENGSICVLYEFQVRTDLTCCGVATPREGGDNGGDYYTIPKVL